ncbi:hypothetical protein [Paractinoplanes durhamensis]|uniref:hypothetical protein n=1 Tax=Paractinoplanes durhamensis TaxID=113563 RepID=UPI00364409EB
MGEQTVPVDPAVTDDLTPGQKVTATVRGATGTPGQVADAVQDGRAEVTAAAATSAALPSALAGAHTLTIVPISLGSDDGTTVTRLQTMGRQLGDFWSAQTSGGLTVADSGINVHAWVTATSSQVTPNDCDADQWKAAALDTLGKTEADFTGRNHLVVYMADGASTCTWAGLGYQPGNIIWLNGYNYADGLEHEFGHNLGLDHAGDSNCAFAVSGSTVTQNCETVEYGDYDVMGYARYGDGSGLNTAKADQLGLLNSVTPAAGTKVTIAPRSARNGVRALKVSGGGSTYYVEFRPNPNGTVAGEGDTPSPGVQIRKSAGGLSTVLPGLRYTDDSDPQSSALPSGRAMALPGTGYEVVNQSESAGGAVVYLRAATATTVAAPGVQSPAAGATTPLTTTVTWNAPATTSADAIAGYLLVVDGTQYVTTPEMRVRQLSLAAGTHQISVTTIGVQGRFATTTRTFTASSSAPQPSPSSSSSSPAPTPAPTPTVTSVNGSQAASSATAITVTWAGTAATYHAELTTASGDQVWSSTGTTATSATVAVQPGTYYARITPVAADDTTGTPLTSAAIAVTRPASPKVTLPPQGSTRTVLRWQATTGATKYTVTVGGITTTVPAGTTRLVLTLARGTHTVAVRSYDARGVASAAATSTVTVARTWTATAAKITAPKAGKVAASVTLKWAAPAVKTGDPAVTGYDVRTDTGKWVTVSAATRSRTVKLAGGKHTLTVRTRYETGATAQTTVKVTR